MLNKNKLDLAICIDCDWQGNVEDCDSDGDYVTEEIINRYFYD